MKDEEVQLLFSLLTTHRKQKQVAAGGNVTSCLKDWEAGLLCHQERLQNYLAWTVLLRNTALPERTRWCWKWYQGRYSREVCWVKNKKWRFGFTGPLNGPSLGGGVCSSGWVHSWVINADQAFTKYKDLCQLWISSGVSPIHLFFYH